MTMDQIHILLVEDDTDYASLLIQRLASNREAAMVNYRVAHVLTLQAAIAHVTDQLVDIILLDLTLPGTSGLHTIERMQETSPAIAIIVLTAADDKLLTTQALQTGVEDYLIKGQFDKEILVRAIRYALDRKRNRNALLASKRGWSLAHCKYDHHRFVRRSRDPRNRAQHARYYRTAASRSDHAAGAEVAKCRLDRKQLGARFQQHADQHCCSKRLSAGQITHGQPSARPHRQGQQCRQYGRQPHTPTDGICGQRLYPGASHGY